MNGFLQQYGLNIVAVIIVLAFIVFASVFGDTITTGVKDITADFFAKSGVTADVGREDECAGGHTDSDTDNICDSCDAVIVEQTVGDYTVAISMDDTFNSGYEVQYYSIDGGKTWIDIDTLDQDGISIVRIKNAYQFRLNGNSFDDYYDDYLVGNVQPFTTKNFVLSKNIMIWGDDMGSYL